MSEVVDPFDQTNQSDEVPPEPGGFDLETALLKLPPERREWLREQLRRGETTPEGLLSYVDQYLRAPQTVAPAVEASLGAEVAQQVTESGEAMLRTMEAEAEAAQVPDRQPSDEGSGEIGAGADMPFTDEAAVVSPPEPVDPSLVEAQLLAARVEAYDAHGAALERLEGEAEVQAAAADAEEPAEEEQPPPAEGEALPQQSVLQRMWDHPEIPQEQKEDWAARFASGALNEVMLGVLVESYDEEEEQTDQSDDPIAEAPPVEVEPEPVVIESEGEQLTLMRGSDLAPPDEEEIPPPPDQSLPPPPGSTHGIFFIEKNRFGAGTWGIDICHSDGTMEPVMVYLARTHPEWGAAEVADWLLRNGLPQEHAVRLGRQRGDMKEGAEVVLQYPGVKALMEEEERHITLKDEFSKAFVQSRSKKDK